MDWTEVEPDMPFTPVGELTKSYARRHPKKCALYDLETDSAMTWGEIDEWSCRIANHLEDLGIRHGDRVALVADECIEKLLMWLGLWRLGAVVCLFDVGMKAETLAEMLRAVAPRLLLWNDGAPQVASLDTAALPRLRFARWPAGEFFGRARARSRRVERPRRDGGGGGFGGDLLYLGHHGQAQGGGLRPSLLLAVRTVVTRHHRPNRRGPRARVPFVCLELVAHHEPDAVVTARAHALRSAPLLLQPSSSTGSASTALLSQLPFPQSSTCWSIGRPA